MTTPDHQPPPPQGNLASTDHTSGIPSTPLAPPPNTSNSASPIQPHHSPIGSHIYDQTRDKANYGKNIENKDSPVHHPTSPIVVAYPTTKTHDDDNSMDNKPPGLCQYDSNLDDKEDTHSSIQDYATAESVNLCPNNSANQTTPTVVRTQLTHYFPYHRELILQPHSSPSKSSQRIPKHSMCPHPVYTLPRLFDPMQKITITSETPYNCQS